MEPILIPDNKLDVFFQSDGFMAGKGFNLTYQEQESMSYRYLNQKTCTTWIFFCKFYNQIELPFISNTILVTSNINSLILQPI